jgi:nitrous oxidase accessory protein NosD
MRFRWILALAALCAAAPSQAAVYHVSTTGSDSNNGVTAPFRTLQKAVSVLQNGDIIVLLPGTYTAGATLTDRQNVTIRGIGTVVLDGTGKDFGILFRRMNGLVLDNLKIRNCVVDGVYGENSRNLTVIDSEFSNNGKTGLLVVWTSDVLIQSCTAFNNQLEHGIYLARGGDRYTVRNCRLFGNGFAGLQINAVSPDSLDPVSPTYATPNLSTDCVVEANTIYGNGSNGAGALSLMGVQRSLIVNNLLYDNLAGGIILFDNAQGKAWGCKDNRILHNTVVFQPGTGRYGISLHPGSTGNQVMNNIFVVGDGSAIRSAEPVQSNFNCFLAPTIANNDSLSAWQQATGNDLNSGLGDPGLNAQFHPLPSSPVLGAGTPVYGRDKDGRLRPAGVSPDIGCYEEGGSPGPSVTVTSPNGGESQVIGTYRAITWTSSGLTSAVKIEYSTDGGATWHPIYSSTPNDGAALWTVQPIPTSLARVRISSVADSGIADVSDGNFTLSPLMLTGPNAGETQVGGTIQAITWSGSSLAGGDVKIDYSTDGGVNWIPIYNRTPNDGHALWTVQFPTTALARIRISSFANPSIFDVSDGTFTIVPIVLTFPNGGETALTGTNQAIRWISSSPVGDVKIDYSVNGGTSWIPIYPRTPNDGFAPWTVQLPPTTQCRIRVTAFNNPAFSDMSDGDFTTVPIVVTAPAGGDVLAAGTQQPITWNSSVVGNVNVEFSPDGGATWLPVETNTLNDGQALWAVPFSPTDQGRIRVSAAGNPAYFDESGDFTICSLTVISPNGPEVLTAGTEVQVTWTSQHVPGKVRVEFSTDGGTSWQTISSNAEDDGAIPWTVPNQPTTQARVRITSVRAPLCVDVSDGFFTIQAAP